MSMRHKWLIRILAGLAICGITLSGGCQPLGEDTLGTFVGDFLRQLAAALLL